VGRNGERTAVILDSHPLWLDALERLLDRVGVTVVGKTTSPAEALRMVEKTCPSVFITDYDAIDESNDGLASLRRASRNNPDVHSVVVSTRNDPADIEAAFAAGASVYCVKTADPDDLASAIRQAFQSSIYYAGARGRGSETVTPSPPPVGMPPLTKREVEILRLVADGHSNAQLAKMLWVTEQTVKFHLSNVYRKLDVANRTEASRWAQLHGLLTSTVGGDRDQHRSTPTPRLRLLTGPSQHPFPI
jgi:DNA-binding NarL/FixJ family response regulator